MGYRSDVAIALAVRGDSGMTEIFAAYSILPLVQKHNLAAEWNFDRTHEDVTIAWFKSDDIKWYDNYDEVKGIKQLREVADNFQTERGFEWAYKLLRIGEDDDDMECTNDETEKADELSEILWDTCRIRRTMEVGLVDGDAE